MGAQVRGCASAWALGWAGAWMGGCENCGAVLCGVLRNYLDFLDGQAERLEVRLLLSERRRAARAALRGRHESAGQRTEEWRAMM